MKTRVVIKPVRKLNSKDYGQCLDLNMGDLGDMRTKLEKFHKKTSIRESYAVMLKGEGGEILAWALIWKRPRPKNLSIQWESYFYCPPIYRRHGYSTRIAKVIAKEISPKFIVSPWDDVSRLFFNSISPILNKVR